MLVCQCAFLYRSRSAIVCATSRLRAATDFMRTTSLKPTLEDPTVPNAWITSPCSGRALRMVLLMSCSETAEPRSTSRPQPRRSSSETPANRDRRLERAGRMIDGIEQPVVVAIASLELQRHALGREVLRADPGVQRVAVVVVDRRLPAVDEPRDWLVEIRPCITDAERDVRVPTRAVRKVPDRIRVEGREIEVDVGPVQPRDVRRAVSDRELEAPRIGEALTVSNAVRDVIVELRLLARDVDAVEVVAELLCGVETELVPVRPALVFCGGRQRLQREHSERRGTDQTSVYSHGGLLGLRIEKAPCRYCNRFGWPSDFLRERGELRL